MLFDAFYFIGVKKKITLGNYLINLQKNRSYRLFTKPVRPLILVF